MTFVRVYDLRSDHDLIKHMQQASLTRPDAGLALEPALVGSDDWWALIQKGALSQSIVEGVIRRVYWASMGDWPEFEVESANGDLSQWTREGDISRYVEGLQVRMGFVRHPWKEQLVNQMAATHSSLVIFVEIEESSLRSDPRAPGPGGIGLR